MAGRYEEAPSSGLSPTQGDEAATVLVVDDDPSLVAMLRILFEEQGCRVLQATNGREAIEAHLAHEGVDLIISDIDMPGMDGIEMCRWLDCNAAGAQVIIISGMDVDPEEVRASAASVVDFFAKPVRVSDLLATAMASIAP